MRALSSLVKALAYLKANRGESLRKKGQRIACITYTDVATKEILSDVGDDPILHVSTIHSFLWVVVKPFQTDIKKWVEQRIVKKIAELEEKRAGFSSRVHQKTRIENQNEIQKYRDLQSACESSD